MTTKYRVKVYINGKQVTKVFKRKSDADKWKMRMLVDREKGLFDPGNLDSEILFKDFMEIWWKNKNMIITQKTKYGYSGYLKNHINPVFGLLKLKDIKLQHGQALLSSLYEKGKNPKGINTIFTLAKGIFNDAVRWEYLMKNPFKNIPFVKEQPRTPVYWMPDEIKKFLLAAKTTELYEFFVVALNTGMRRGELGGLCWDRVDFENRLIHVSRTRDRYGLRESTKTNSSFRFIPMNDACFEAINSLKAQNRSSQLVFTYQNGKALDVQHLVERQFRKIINEAGVKRIRFHDLRATFAANICMAPNGDLYALSKILGHSSVDMTVKRYAHLHNDFLKKVSNAVSFT